MRYVGLDVHRDFCEVAMLEQGVFVACGRVETHAGSAGGVRRELDRR